MKEGMTAEKFQKVWDWAKNNKAEVYQLAEKYSGGFLKALVEAFIHADYENTVKILRGWHDYFVDLYDKREVGQGAKKGGDKNDKEEG